MQAFNPPRSSLRRTVASWAITCAICLLFLVVSSRRWSSGLGGHAGTSNEAGPFTVAAADLDYGERFQGSEFDWTVTLRNTADRAVGITELRASCDCASVEPKSGVVGPRAALPVRMHLKLPILPEPTADTHPHAVRLTAVMAEDGDDKTLSWIVGGLATRPLALSTHLIDWGDSLSTEPHGVQSVLTAKPRTARVMDIIPQAREHIEVQMTRSPGEYQFRISPRGRLTPGSFTDKVSLDLLGSDNAIIGTVSIPVLGTVVDDFVPQPRTVILGGARIGREVAETVRITSRTARPLTSAALGTAQQPDLAVKLRWLGDGTVELKCTPTRAGNVTAVAKIVIESSGERRNLSIPVVYYGITDLEWRANVPAAGPLRKQP